jgi:protein TonB
MLRLRLISTGLAGLICFGIVWVAFSQRFSAIQEFFDDSDVVKVEVEEKEKPKPPPPPPDKPPPPPPPVQNVPPPVVETPPQVTFVPTVVTPPPPPVPEVITNPQWVRRPSGRDFAREYPERALEREREGRVVLACVVAADGTINCNVASEEPEGWGFGQAALRISRSFQMAPMTVDGRPTGGGRVSVPIRFQLGG